MSSSKFGALAAAAVLSLVGAGIAQADHHEGAEKACYRTECGKSVKGHQGKCGGTKVEELKDEAACTAAGGAWVTAAEAEKFKKNM
jgi:hypothetical protein